MPTTITRSINFNGIETLTTGKVVGMFEGFYIVDFEWAGIQFRGMWKK